MSRKLSVWNKKQAELRKQNREECQNGIKSWHEDPTGCQAVKNVMKQNISLKSHL